AWRAASRGRSVPTAWSARTGLCSLSRAAIRQTWARATYWSSKPQAAEATDRRRPNPIEQEKRTMIFGRSERGKPPVEPVTLKILVAGGFGVGKTTFVGAVSEIRPLRTEEVLTEAGRPVDDTSGVEGKYTTTVAMDFGPITLRADLILYLFGTPGQERFWFMWDELSEGALGAVVLADTRRLENGFAAVDYFERRAMPFLVGVNCFEGAAWYPAETVRQAL